MGPVSYTHLEALPAFCISKHCKNITCEKCAEEEINYGSKTDHCEN